MAIHWHDECTDRDEHYLLLACTRAHHLALNLSSFDDWFTARMIMASMFITRNVLDILILNQHHA